MGALYLWKACQARAQVVRAVRALHSTLNLVASLSALDHGRSPNHVRLARSQPAWAVPTHLLSRSGLRLCSNVLLKGQFDNG
jgi:hypothetical protein